MSGGLSEFEDTIPKCWPCVSQLLGRDAFSLISVLKEEQVVSSLSVLRLEVCRRRCLESGCACTTVSTARWGGHQGLLLRRRHCGAIRLAAPTPTASTHSRVMVRVAAICRRSTYLRSAIWVMMTMASCCSSTWVRGRRRRLVITAATVWILLLLEIWASLVPTLCTRATAACISSSITTSRTATWFHIRTTTVVTPSAFSWLFLVLPVILFISFIVKLTISLFIPVPIISTVIREWGLTMIVTTSILTSSSTVWSAAWTLGSTTTAATSSSWRGSALRSRIIRFSAWIIRSATAASTALSVCCCSRWSTVCRPRWWSSRTSLLVVSIAFSACLPLQLIIASSTLYWVGWS